ncbi:PKD-like family lipoprotein [Chitinophaga filiformis]|uniref:PKD-like family protein n=1 Tax=Chitinophaga filiformis TaxID=104663 RepID=A0A1G8DJK1_CHIFI|nr:PKD-like family lipoprotein [Chitinophaga filiformis]SDH57835.1 PKD-like family protein [Chitinophaga filiformis]
MKILSRYILPSLLSLLVLSACKKDLGDYDYTKVGMPVIDTAGIGNPYYIERYASLQIDPPIQYEGGDTKALRYQWLLYPNITNSTSGTITVKTISTEKTLNVPIVEKVGEYRVELIATDTTNQLKVNMIFTVVVSVGIEYGIMVLHSAQDSSDVDFITTANAVPVAGITPKHLRGIFSASTGSKIAGAPRFIAQERRSQTTQNWITIGSAGHMARMSGSDFSLLREDKALFRRSDAVINPQAFMLLGNGYSALINDGRLHMYTTVYETDALFSASVPGDYELAPYLAMGSYYSVVAAVYDQKHAKFIHPASLVGSMIDFVAPPDTVHPPFDLRNIGKDMLYMDRGFNNYTHAFFKDKTGNGYWLYVINFNTTDNGTLAISANDMSMLPEISTAKFFQASEQGYVDLYATDRKIYAYNYQGTNTATLAFDGLPAGETITCMKIYKPNPNYNLTTVTGWILYVGTWDGQKGKVYELQLNALSGQINTTPLNVFEGFGKVADINAKARGAGTY